MIVLDTNVVSEPLKTDGNVVVQTWLDQQSAETLYLTATSLSELLVGIEILPKGKRKAGLAVALTELMTKLFKNRILRFDGGDRVCAPGHAASRSRQNYLRCRRPHRRDRGSSRIHHSDTGYDAVCLGRCAGCQPVERLTDGACY